MIALSNYFPLSDTPWISNDNDSNGQALHIMQKFWHHRVLKQDQVEDSSSHRVVKQFLHLNERKGVIVKISKGSLVISK